MKKDRNVVGLIISSIFIITSIIEIGVAVSFYMFTTADFDKYSSEYIYEIASN